MANTVSNGDGGLLRRCSVAASLLLFSISAYSSPTISLTSPGDGWSYNAPVNIVLKSSAAVGAGDNATLSKVEFYADGTLLGTDTTSAYSVTWSNAPVGSHVITAVATDSLGQTTTSKASTITVEATNSAPTVSLSAPANNATYALPASISLTASAADVEKNGSVAQVEFLVDGQVIATVSAKPYSYAWANPPAGTHVLTARATDNLGAQSLSAERTLNVLANPVPPTVTLGGVADGTYVLPVTLNLTASAKAGATNTPLTQVQFQANGQVLATLTQSPYAYTWANPANGAYTLSVVATDSLGQTTTSNIRTITITDTNSAPTVSLTAPANNATYALPASISLTASAADVEKNGSVSQVEFLADGQVIATVSAKPYTYAWANPPAGTHVLTARATDNLGAQSLSAERTLNVLANPVPPTVTLGGVTDGTYVLPVTLNLTSSAKAGATNTPLTQVQFQANGQVLATLTQAPYTYAWVNPVADTYALTAIATDSLGQTTTSAARTVTIAASASPPTAALTAPANNSIYVLPADIVLNASVAAVEKNASIAQVEFLADGQVIATLTAKPYTFTWSNPPVGTHTLTVRATDSLGLQTISTARTVTLSDINAPPKVSLTAPANKASFGMPADIQLTASASGPEANTPIVQVDFLADGNVLGSVTAKPYSYLWNNVPAGTHILNVRATDSLGAVTLSQVRTISVVNNISPIVDITAPPNNAIYVAPASLSLTASASETNGSIAKVDFYNGTTLIGTATAAPYTVNWANVAAGAYSITAVATDALGTSTTSAAVNVNVVINNPPTVSLSATPTIAATPATIILTATAADSDGSVTKVEFYNGATLIGTASEPPYSATWNDAPPGNYRVTAIATDNMGSRTTSDGISVSVTGGPALVYYIHTDQLNTPRLITDDSGNLVWTWESDPFGVTPPNQDPGNTGTQFVFNQRFPGQYADKETGTFYNYFRDYDPTTGRYLESDPIGLAGGQLSTYTYAANNPLKYTDRSGLILPAALYVFLVEYGATAAVATEAVALIATNTPSGASSAASFTGRAAQQLSYDVYLGIKNGEPVYAGITSNLAARSCQHGDRFDNLLQLTSSPVTKDQARAIEQVLINNNPQFQNQINSIAPTRTWYQEAVQWGSQWLSNLVK